MTERFITYCALSDAMGTRDMIRAGGGTVVTTKPARVVDADGRQVAGLVMGYDLPVLESSS
jgi:hypothetical protein